MIWVRLTNFELQLEEKCKPSCVKALVEYQVRLEFNVLRRLLLA